MSNNTTDAAGLGTALPCPAAEICPTITCDQTTDHYSNYIANADNFFNLMVDLYIAVLLICAAIILCKIHRRYTKKYFLLSPREDGWIITIQKSVFGLRKNGEVHDIYCTQDGYDLCGCMDSKFVKKAVEQVYSNPDYYMVPAVRPASNRLILKGAVTTIFGLIFLDLECVMGQSIDTDKLAQDYASSALVILAMLFLIVSLFLKTKIFMLLSIHCCGIGLTIHGFIKGEITLISTISAVAGCLTVATTLVAIVLTAVKSGPNSCCKEQNASLAEIVYAETGQRVDLPTVSSVTTGPDVVRLRKHNILHTTHPAMSTAILFLALFATASLLIGSVSASTLQCVHGQNEPDMFESDIGKRTVRLNLALEEIADQVMSTLQYDKTIAEMTFPLCIVSLTGINDCRNFRVFINDDGVLAIDTGTGSIPIDSYRLAWADMKQTAVPSNFSNRALSEVGGSIWTQTTVAMKDDTFKIAAEVLRLMYQVVPLRDPTIALSADTRRKKRFLALFSATAGYALKAQSCTGCVDKDTFEKWRKSIEKSIDKTVDAATDITSELSNTNGVLEAITTAASQNTAAINSLREKIADTYEAGSRWVFSYAHTDLYAAAFQRTTEQAHKLETYYQNILVDAVRGGKPVLSSGQMTQLIGTELQLASGLKFEITELPEMHTDGEQLVLMFRIDRQNVVRDSPASYEEIDACFKVTADGLQSIPNIYIIRNSTAGSTLYNIQTTVTSDRSENHENYVKLCDGLNITMVKDDVEFLQCDMPDGRLPDNQVRQDVVVSATDSGIAIVAMKPGRYQFAGCNSNISGLFEKGLTVLANSEGCTIDIHCDDTNIIVNPNIVSHIHFEPLFFTLPNITEVSLESAAFRQEVERLKINYTAIREQIDVSKVTNAEAKQALNTARQELENARNVNFNETALELGLERLFGKGHYSGLKSSFLLWGSFVMSIISLVGLCILIVYICCSPKRSFI